VFEGLGDGEGLAYALNTVGTAQLRADDAPLAWARLHRSLDMALAHGFDEHAARAYTNIASLLVVHRRYAELDRPCAEGAAYCEARDMDMYWCRLHIRHSYALLQRGRWNEAEEEIEAVRHREQLTGLEQEQSAHVQALLDLRRGAPRSDAYWQAQVDGRHALSVDPWYAPQAVARCEAAWLRGDDALVRRIASTAFDAASRSGECWRIGELACWLRRAGGETPRIAQPVAAPCAHELAGDLRGAAAAWAALGCRYEQALALLGGDAADLREAHALLDELGAAPAARIARRRLRALGVRDLQRGTNRRTRTDPLGLTARERQVLELLAKALSNRAIAQQLHRSERTVENHVAALLGKLGVASRNEAVALVRTLEK
jgi:DNA-binding CsgD family transcriptional regulator